MTDLHPVGTWFPHTDEDVEVDPRPGWQPRLNTNDGCTAGIEAWFESRQDCLDWMRENRLTVEPGADSPEDYRQERS